ncbi:MAG: MoxR family ATPase [Pseudohongiella sp.]|nr:MoxR family ATPase [Pseudohongiella sp.]MDO9520233.1 MoxR family ATPase [Pseudohongiella sp.]MDP2127038.1 MoxR family ATPase [Pseudohongiella sp.]
MQAQIDQALTEISSVVLGKDQQIRLALCCLLSGGHLLIEDLPGMGKTTLAQSLAKVFGLDFRRVQFTSDLLPADILGVSVYETATGSFVFHEGPVFCQLLLADEINRATPKTQSALLEAMEEAQVTIEGQTRSLPSPFFVIATQNPVSLAGTYPLPESQSDRFLMRLTLGYPDPAAERILLERAEQRSSLTSLRQCFDVEQLATWREQANQIKCSAYLLDYVQRLIACTRDDGRFRAGLSPRGGIALIRAAKTFALMAGRDHVIPEDVQAIFASVAEHRLQTHNNATRQSGETSSQWILNTVDVFATT